MNTEEVKAEFELDVFGIAPDTAIVQVVKGKHGTFLKFCPSYLESPDFVLFGDNLKEFSKTLSEYLSAE